MFSINKQYIKDNLSIDIPNVVCTHHAPDVEMCDLARYGENYMNSGYATNILEEFKDYDIRLWVSGHTHAVMDKILHGVRCVSNCKGYYLREKVVGFDSNKTVEI